MSTVIKNKVHTAKISHTCDDCRKMIWPGEKYRRLFGAAFDGDPKYEIKLCHRCTKTEDDGHIAMYLKD